jgi:hypothetical protein
MASSLLKTTESLRKQWQNVVLIKDLHVGPNSHDVAVNTSKIHLENVFLRLKRVISS